MARVASLDFDGAPPSDEEVLERGLVDKVVGSRCNVETARELWMRVPSKDEAGMSGGRDAYRNSSSSRNDGRNNKQDEIVLELHGDRDEKADSGELGSSWSCEAGGGRLRYSSFIPPGSRPEYS